MAEGERVGGDIDSQFMKRSIWDGDWMPKGDTSLDEEPFPVAMHIPTVSTNEDETLSSKVDWS